jgi:hypothetical protein
MVNSLPYQAQGPQLILQNSEKKEREKDRERQKDFEVFQKEQANIKVSRDTKNDEINQIKTKGKRIKQRVVSQKINNIDKSITIVMKRKREKDKN